MREAHAADRLLDTVPFLSAAAALRASPRPPGPAAERLVSDGEAEPQLVCIPSFLAGSGPHQFVRLAAALPRRRRVRALTLPGFVPGEPASASWSSTVDSLAEAAGKGSGQHPFVLVGYSIGGALALAAAEKLEHDGADIAGVVLLDMFDPAEDPRPVFAWAMGEVLGRDIAVDDESLLTMGAYLRLLGDRTAARPAGAHPADRRGPRAARAGRCGRAPAAR